MEEDWSTETFHVLMMELIKRTTKVHNDCLLPYGLNGVCGHFLLTLYKEGALTQNELNERLRVDKAHTSRVIKLLLEKGYVIKKGAGEKNNKIELNESGKQAAKAVVTMHMELYRKFSLALSEEEKNAIMSALLKLTQLAREMDVT